MEKVFFFIKLTVGLIVSFVAGMRIKRQIEDYEKTTYEETKDFQFRENLKS